MLAEATAVILRWRMVPTFARAMWHAFLFWLHGKPVFAPKSAVIWRRHRCATCDDSTKTRWNQCTVCLCAVEPKITLSSESCPKHRWKALDGGPKQSLHQ